LFFRQFVFSRYFNISLALSLSSPLSPHLHPRPSPSTQTGDTIHLAHVIADPSGISTQYNANSTAERRLSQEVFLRLEHEASLMMQTRFVPALQFTGINHTIEIIKLKVDKSAGAIGEALAAKAAALEADLLVIASHGAGVMADFGSVARWCSEHSTVPVVLIPPAIMNNPDAPAGNTLIIGASDSLETLRQGFEFVTTQLARPGDAIMLFNVIAPCSEEAAIEARKQLVISASQWQEQSTSPLAKTINVGCDVLDSPIGGAMGSAAALGNQSSFEDAGCPAGEKVLMYSEDMNARVVVFGHHGRGSMMREVVWGPLTAHITRQCAKALVVWNPK
jgi:hypothetical protein